MNRSTQLLCCAAMLLTAPILAQELPEPRSERTVIPFFQDPSAPRQAPAYVPSSSDRYESAHEAIHRREALKAAQRRQRMAINKYFGYSPLRPPSSSVPSMSSPFHRPVVIWIRPTIPASRFLTPVR